MNNLINKKKEYLLSIEDVLDVIEASKIVAKWFVKSKKTSPEYQLENYVCFHKDCKYGVYLDKDKFHFVSILRPKKFLGIESTMSIQVVSEILTDDLEDSHKEKASISGATLLRKDTDSEKIFFKAITSYDDAAAADQALDLQNKIRDEAERKAKEETERQAREEAERKAKEEMERQAREDAERKAKEETERQAREEAERKAKEETERQAREEAERKAKEEMERQAREEAEKIAKEKSEKAAFLSTKYGEDVARAFISDEVALGMPISVVQEIKGQGHDRKRKISKQGETIKEKYGKSYKYLSSGERSKNASYKLEIEYERDESGQLWLVSGFKDL